MTLPSHTSILTGRNPFEHGVRDNAGYRLADDHVTLAEMARRIPTVMVFVKSLGGVSHTNAEDTPEADLEASVRALAELTRRVLARP